MRILIQKSNVWGVVKAPSSKSYSIRGLMAAALANGQSEICHLLDSDDTETALSVLKKMGLQSQKDGDTWKVNGGNLHNTCEELFCHESAATLRFLTAVCSLVPGEFNLTAGSSLAKRPLTPLIKALEQWGAKIKKPRGIPSISIKGGNLVGGLTEIPGDVSSQFISALLLIAPLIKNPVHIHLTTPPESKAYILMTLECLSKFGIQIDTSADLIEYAAVPQSYKATRYEVEGDWSSASYLLALGALTGEIRVENLNCNSLQGDKVIIDFLKQMGASISVDDRYVSVKRSRLLCLKADLNECIDLLPTVAVLASLAEGRSELTGLKRARLKESDRISSVKQGLIKSGIEVKEKDDSLIITGGKPHSAIIDSKNDHRIAMAFSLMGVASGGIEIEGAECVSKTYPDYWSTINSLGARIDEQ